jgi:hypothetical protein
MSAREEPPVLPDALASLVAAERQVPTVDPALAARLFARLDTALVDAGTHHDQFPEDAAPDAGPQDLGPGASGAGVVVGAAKGALGTGTALLSKALVAKVAVGLALLTAGGVGGVAVAPRVRPQPERIVYVTRTVRVLVPSEPIAPQAPTPVRVPTQDVVQSPTNDHVTLQHPTSMEVPSSVAERLLIERARTAVQEALRQHEQRFPRGTEREEREALRVEALSGAGRVEEARALARRFFGQYPGSIYAPRLRSVTQE